MKKILTTAVLATALLFAAACGEGGGSDDGSAGSKTLRLASVLGPTTLDPALSVSGGNYLYLRLIYDRLLENDPETLEPTPGLATEWSFNDDNTELTLTLREGVTFTDGAPFDADAAKKNLDRFIDIGQLNRLSTVTEVRVDDPTHVTLVQDRPNVFLAGQLTDNAGIMVSPKAIDANPEDVTATPIGSGPYTFVSQVPGASLELELNKDYWNDKRGFYGKYSYKFFANPVSMVQALQAGSIDFVDRVPASDYKTISEDDRFTGVSQTTLGLRTIVFNSRLVDRDARRALNLALDRDSMAEATDHGLATPLNQMFPENYYLYSEKAAGELGRDVAAAKKIVADEGLDGTTIKCVAYPGIGYETMGPFIIDQAKEIGLDVKMTIKPLADAMAQFYTQDDYDCFFTSWTGQMTPNSTLTGVYGADSYYNPGRNHGDGIDQSLLAKFEQSPEVGDQKAIAEQIALQGIEDSTTIPLFTRPKNVVMTTAVDGYVGDLMEHDLALLKPAN